jgi:hypothetical protein
MHARGLLFFVAGPVFAFVVGPEVVVGVSLVQLALFRAEVKESVDAVRLYVYHFAL